MKTRTITLTDEITGGQISLTTQMSEEDIIETLTLHFDGMPTEVTEVIEELAQRFLSGDYMGDELAYLGLKRA